jgi:hypothetical protein
MTRVVREYSAHWRADWAELSWAELRVWTARLQCWLMLESNILVFMAYRCEVPSTLHSHIHRLRTQIRSALLIFRAPFCARILQALSLWPSWHKAHAKDAHGMCRAELWYYTNIAPSMGQNISVDIATCFLLDDSGSIPSNVRFFCSQRGPPSNLYIGSSCSLIEGKAVGA